MTSTLSWRDARQLETPVDVLVPTGLDDLSRRMSRSVQRRGCTEIGRHRDEEERPAAVQPGLLSRSVIVPNNM